jgi:hypothetical protein
MKKVISILIYLLGNLLLVSSAVADVLDTGIIHFDADGSANMIGGTANMEGYLELPQGSTFEYFTFELLNLYSSQSYPSSIRLSFLVVDNYNKILSGGGVGFSNTQIGSIRTVNPTDFSDYNAHEALKGFIYGSGVTRPNKISVDVGYNTGGFNVFATGDFLLTANGTAAPPVVPEPTNYLLFISGSFVFIGRHYWKKSSTV